MDTCIFCLEDDLDVVQCASRFGCGCRYHAHINCDNLYHARTDAKCIYCRHEAIHPAHGDFAIGGGIPLNQEDDEADHLDHGLLMGGGIHLNENAFDELPDLIALEDQINNIVLNNHLEINQINFILEQMGVVIDDNILMNVNIFGMEENEMWGGGFPLLNHNDIPIVNI